jgi:hypothetical protein
MEGLWGVVCVLFSESKNELMINLACLKHFDFSLEEVRASCFEIVFKSSKLK